MPNFADLASVFQLGAGVSLALSVFKEPIALAEERVRAKLERKEKLLTNSKSAKVNDKRQDVLQKKADLRVRLVEAEAKSQVPKALILFGVFANFALLFASVLNPGAELSTVQAVGLLLISAGPYLIALCWLQLLAAVHIGSGD